MSTTRSPTLLIDLAGGSLVALCLLALVWFSFLRGDASGAAVKDLTKSMAELQQNYLQAERIRDQQTELLATRKAQLATGSRLPERAPVDAYYLVLTDMARRHDMQVRSHDPIAGRAYVGVRERRFSYVVEGSWAGLVALLAEVESTPYWADIAYLKIEPSTSAQRRSPDERTAALVFSLFYSPPEPAAGDSGDL